MVKVKLFTTLREVAGTREVEIDAKTLSEALEELTRRFGEKMRKLVFSETGEVNKALIFVLNGVRVRTVPELRLEEDDVLAIFPPVAGGGLRGQLRWQSAQGELANQRVKLEPLHREDALDFGDGLTCAFLHRGVPQIIGALSPEKCWSWPRAHRLALFSQRLTVKRLSVVPHSQVCGGSHFGGHLAAELELASFDFLVVEDANRKLRYLCIYILRWESGASRRLRAMGSHHR